MKRQVAVSVLLMMVLVLATSSSTPASAQEVTAATAAVSLHTDKAAFCADGATVRIDFSDVADLYGYQFEVHYDAGRVTASATFVNSFFDTTGPTDAIPPGWNADCSDGVCKFGVSKTDPAAPVSGSGSVAEITFAMLQAGEFDVTIHNDYLSMREVKLRKKVQPNLPCVSSDPETLQQVFTALVLNTCESMPRGRVLHVTARTPKPGWVEIEFRGTGPGVPADQLPKVFDPFFRTMPEGKSDGLGLSVSNVIVRQYGGVIEVQSQVGKGTAFNVRLPESKPVGGREVA